MAFVPGSCVQPTAQLELSLSCRDLACRDIASYSDPMVVTYIMPFGEKRWVEHHRTEVLKNCQTPDFVSKVHLTYRFEEQQPLKFDVYDIDSSSSSLSEHDFLGSAECTLGQIVSHSKVELALTGKGAKGKILILAEEMMDLKHEVILKLRAIKVDKKDFFGKSDPFLQIFKSTEVGNYSLVHRTEVIKGTLDPSWKEFVLRMRDLCNGDKDRDIQISCYDWNKSGDHELIGDCHFTLRSLDNGEKTFTFVHPQKKARKKDAYKGSGQLVVDKYELRSMYSFTDYIKGGTQINCTFAIDFTASNGHPMSTDSLHFVGALGGRLNPYEEPILSVGNIMQDYDSDKMFPVLGFGARLPPNGQVSHEFFVNFHASNPYCAGVQGVLDAYRNCIRQVQLYGPTNFSPVINHVAKFAAAHMDGSHYFILLIITDGVISDMQETCKAVINACELPMSIVILGVGDADFTAMEQLDGDTVAVSAGGGVRASRDIVQFVPYNKVAGPVGGTVTPGNLLARHVLAEIPQQLEAFMKSRGIIPQPPTKDIVELPHQTF